MLQAPEKAWGFSPHESSGRAYIEYGKNLRTACNLRALRKILASQFHGILVVLSHSHVKRLETTVQQPRHMGIRGGTV